VQNTKSRQGNPKEVASLTKLRLKAKLFKGFADATRLAIFEALKGGEKSVSQIVEATGFNQPNVSNHLNTLRESGLVRYRQKGRNVYYSIRDKRVAQALDIVEEILVDISKETYESLINS